MVKSNLMVSIIEISPREAGAEDDLNLYFASFIIAYCI